MNDPHPTRATSHPGPAARPPAGGEQGTAAVRATTMRWQGLANRIVRGLLRTPVVSRVVGARLITVYVVGRKSGRRYAVPVAYTHHDGALLIGTPFAWGRNLRTGQPVDIRLKGKRRPADVCVDVDAARVAELYGVMARDNRQFAKFNNIAIDEAGEPNPDDLHLAWAAGARAIRLSPR